MSNLAITVNGAVIELKNTGYISAGGKTLHKAELVLPNGDKVILQHYASENGEPKAVPPSEESLRQQLAKAQKENKKLKGKPATTADCAPIDTATRTVVKEVSSMEEMIAAAVAKALSGMKLA